MSEFEGNMKDRKSLNTQSPQYLRDEMSMIDLGGLKLDSKVLVNQIRQDLNDDWFKDPLLYRDMLKPELVKEKIIDNISRNHGVYIPSKINIFDIPKKNFALRYAIEKNLFDRIFYHGLTAFLIPYFDPLFSSRSLSHRLQTTRKRKDKYLFKSGVEQWQMYRGIILSKSKKKALLETDVNSYFENIDVEKIKIRLIEMIKDLDEDGITKVHIRRAIDLLFSCLTKWTFNDGMGLPQNRDASSFLANVLLDQVDKKMVALGYDYYRYMDDINIICDDQHHAQKALMDLIGELRNLGLGVNSAKTKIHVKEDEIKNKLSPDRRIEMIDTLWKSRKKEAILRSFPELIKYTDELIKDDKIDERAFRYCINRIIKVCLCDELEVDSETLKPLTDKIIEELDSNPVSSDQYIIYLKSVKLSTDHINKIIALLVDDKRAIYSWQNYLIWNLLSLKYIRNDKLIDLSTSILDSDVYDQADKAGASLYIGAVGNDDEKLSLAKKFSSLNGFIDKRCALIAIHELSFEDIKDYVVDHVDPELKGIYRNLNKNKSERGVYCIAPEHFEMKYLYDSIGDEHDS